MDKEFKEIYEKTLKWEGGGKLHNVKFDKGGVTVWGIAYNYNKKHFKSLEEFKMMTYDRACEITYANYYLPLQLDKVSPSARHQLFDIGFNMGIKRAIILAQRALNILDDGICGPITLKALNKLDNGCLYIERVNFYNAIVKGNSSQKKFYQGWINRANDFK